MASGAFVLVVAVVVAVAAVHGDSGPGLRACLCLNAGVCAGFRRLCGDAIRRRDSAKSLSSSALSIMTRESP